MTLCFIIHKALCHDINIEDVIELKWYDSTYYRHFTKSRICVKRFEFTFTDLQIASDFRSISSDQLPNKLCVTACP